MSEPVDPADCLGRKLLILGDVNSGKTTLARRILRAFCDRGLGPRIAIVDLAPAIPPEVAAARGVRGVGGTLEADPAAGVLTLRPALQAPRLTSTSEVQALQKAQANRALVDAVWQELDGTGRDLLFVNDASMYLQAGRADALIARLAPLGTVVANGYFGERLGGGALSSHERAEMERLRAWFQANGRVLSCQVEHGRS